MGFEFPIWQYNNTIATTNATTFTVTPIYGNSSGGYAAVPAPVYVVPPPEEPKDLTPLEWLSEQVEEVCELAWAA